jgi:hypothetical protein
VREVITGAEIEWRDNLNFIKRKEEEAQVEAIIN